MSWALRILWWVMGLEAKRRLVVQAKRQGIIAYLKVLQVSRRLLLAILLGFLFLQLIMLAGVGALVTGVWLLELEPQIKLQILFWSFLFLFLVPVGLLGFLFSEHLWYRASGAEKMVDDYLVKNEPAA